MFPKNRTVLPRLSQNILDSPDWAVVHRTQSRKRLQKGPQDCGMWRCAVLCGAVMCCVEHCGFTSYNVVLCRIVLRLIMLWYVETWCDRTWCGVMCWDLVWCCVMRSSTVECAVGWYYDRLDDLMSVAIYCVVSRRALICFVLRWNQLYVPAKWSSTATKTSQKFRRRHHSSRKLWR